MTQDELLRLIDEAAADKRTTLDLSGQGLNELPPEIGNLTNLKTLVLGRWDKKNKRLGNNLKALPDEIGQLTELRSLFLNYNQFEEFPGVVRKLRKLRSLDLCGNRLEQLPDVIGNLCGLRILDLSRNHFGIVPEVLAKFSSLVQLNLSGNVLAIVPEFISNLIKLTTLNIHSNRLTEVPECIGKLTNLTKLYLWRNRLTRVPDCISKLDNLTKLYLSRNQLIEVPNFIGGMTNLTTLNLSSTQLKKAPKCIERLTNLTELYLWGNQLTEIPEYISKLTNLTKLNLSKNQLIEIPDFVGNLTNLTEINLSSNQLTEIPDFVGNLTNLTEINLSSNQLTEIPECISKLTNLTKLNLSNNQLVKMPKLAESLTNLTELYLWGNQLTEVPECISKLTNLTELALSNNQLTEVPEFVGRLTNLTKLNISSNQFTEVPECISKLTNLTKLSLSSNQFLEIPNFVGNLTNLTELYLWGNQLAEIPSFIKNLTDLTVLYLSSNQLQEIPSFIKNLTNLTELYLWENQLTEIPESVRELTNLTTFNLGRNQLTKIPEFVGELTNLTELYLWENQLAEVPKCISKLTNLTKLYLWENQLTEIPEFVENLTNLTELYLNRNQFVEVSYSVGRLTNLTTLDLSRNQLTEIPEFVENLTKLTGLDLSGNQLTEVSECISKLTNLNNLYLSGNQLTEVPDFIRRLTNLTTLNLSSNRLTGIPNCVGKLTNLIDVGLSDNQLTKVPECINSLTNLTMLNLSSNQLTEVPDFVSNLNSLSELHLWGNKLFELPSFLQSLPNLNKLDVRANQLPISPELLGSKHRAETPTAPSNLFKLYFQTPEEPEGAPLYEAKLLIIGEGETGKTTLANKLLNADYELNKEEKSTEGIEVSDFKFNHASGHPCRVNTWDFGGQEIYHATHQFFLTERSVYALVVDSRRENPNFYFWLNVIQLHGGDHSPIIVIKNEKQDRPCNINDLQLRGQFKNLKESVETNLATNRGLDVVKTTIENYISNLPGLGGNFPKSWTQIRNALENLTLGSEFYIDIKEYRDICCRYGIPDRTEQNDLSRTLHNLGIFLHFQDIHTLNKTLFLKPSWCTAAVYKVLDTDAVRKDCGRFNKGDLDKIWSDDQYSDIRSELLALMKEFEVCYEINGYKDHFIAPHLLSPNLPEEDSYAWDEQDNLILTYRYAFKPKNIFPRFIVALHKYIEGQRVVWKHGVVLSILSARAEVIEDVGYERSSIRIRVSGADKKRLIAVIQDHIDRIHDSFERLQVEVLVPCNCSECKNSQTPYTFPHKTLLKSIEKKNYEVQCLYSFELVKVRRLIDEVFEPKSMFEKEQFFEEAKVIRPKMQGTRPGDGHPNDRADMYAVSSDISPDVSEAFANKVAITVNLPEQRYQRSETTNVSGNTITNTTHQHGEGDNIAGDKIGRDKIGTQINNSQASTASNSSPNPSAPHIFISYARKDGTLAAERLHKEMVSAGCSVWRDIESMQGGRVWKKQLREAIRKADAVLVLLTPEAVASKFVEWEWETAETLDKTIIPVLIQACDIPEEWQVLHYRDLSNESIYSKGLSSIIGDLRQ